VLAAAIGALEIAVLTMTPGADLFARFGHTALSVDEGEGRITVYNFGTYRSSDPQLFQKFIHGNIEYYLSTSDWERFERKYERRRITAQVLELTDGEAAHMAAALARTAQPENRSYKYDWFRNNCTTKVRDLIDETLAGALRRPLGGAPAPRRMRQVLRDALATFPTAYHAMSLALNERVDVPLSRWDEAAMPADLMKALAGARRADGRPLVAREWSIEPVGRGPWREPQWPLPSLAAALLGLLALGMRLRAVGGAALALWGLASGLVGLWCIAWWWMPYLDTHANANLVAWSPLALALVPAGALHAAGRLSGRAAWAARRLAETLLGAGALELSFHAIGIARQNHVGYALYALVATAIARIILR
jgi:hypothetical protein